MALSNSAEVALVAFLTRCPVAEVAADILSFRLLNCSPAVVSCPSEGGSDGSATEPEWAHPI